MGVGYHRGPRSLPDMMVGVAIGGGIAPQAEPCAIMTAVGMTWLESVSGGTRGISSTEQMRACLLYGLLAVQATRGFYVGRLLVSQPE